MRRLKKIPKFKDDDAEREFWSKADSTEYIDWSKAQKLVLPRFRRCKNVLFWDTPDSLGRVTTSYHVRKSSLSQFLRFSEALGWRLALARSLIGPTEGVST